MSRLRNLRHWNLASRQQIPDPITSHEFLPFSHCLLTSCMLFSICLDSDQTSMIDCADAHADLVYVGLKGYKIVCIGKDSYINEQCRQPDQLVLSAAWSISKILALRQTEHYMSNLWTAIIVFSNISFFKKNILSFRILWQNQYLLHRNETYRKNYLSSILIRSLDPYSDENVPLFICVIQIRVWGTV